MAKVTIDMLAGMMNKSFDHLEKEIRESKHELKEDIQKVKDQLEKIENGHERRITRLEDDVRMLKTAVNK